MVDGSYRAIIVNQNCIHLSVMFSDRDRTQKIFAFAFMRLMNRDGTTLTDGCHELMVYKVGDYIQDWKKALIFFCHLPCY